MLKQSELQKESIVTISPGVLLLLLTVIVVGSALTYKVISGVKNPSQSTSAAQISDVVTTKDGKQIITVQAKGGYSPRTVTAKSGIPTVLVMKTENSYGCERSFRIPKLGVSQVLPETGLTEIDLGTPTAGAKISGTCSMGMYSVSIIFN